MHSSVAIFSKIFLKNQEQNDPGALKKRSGRRMAERNDARAGA
jgi:hypothetical protein